MLVSLAITEGMNTLRVGRLVTFVALQDVVESLAALLPTLLFLTTTSSFNLLLRVEPFVVSLYGLVVGATWDKAGGHGE